MAPQADQKLASTATSTGQTNAFWRADWLDVHFEAARPEYEAQLRAVGIQPSWSVLDAACGGGPFLPWLAELAGPTGRVFALDLTPDNVALVERRAADWKPTCPVEARVGDVRSLPYPDAAFDAVWFANTTQYLSDRDLETTLAEFRRVVRPGGLVAVKESDVTLWRVLPGPPGLVLHWWEAGATQPGASGDYARACLRAPELPGWLRRAGLVDVWQRAALIERSAPLAPAVREFWRVLGGWAVRAAERALPVADQAFWAQLRDPGALERFLDDPNCWLIEGNILTVGTVSV